MAAAGQEQIKQLGIIQLSTIRLEEDVAWVEVKNHDHLDLQMIVVAFKATLHHTAQFRMGRRNVMWTVLCELHGNPVTHNYPYRAAAPAMPNTGTMQRRWLVQYSSMPATNLAPVQATSPVLSIKPYTAHTAQEDNDSDEEVEEVAAHVLMKVFSHEVLASLDSGAKVNIIPFSLFLDLPIKPTKI